MAELFRREVSLNVGGTLIRTRFGRDKEAAPILKLAFKVVRSLKKEPNAAEISVYNLTKANRVAFQEEDIETELEAGYIDNVSQIFKGKLDFAENKLAGRDWVTTLQTSDSGKSFRSARINTSIKGPANIGDVLQAAGSALGINVGNLAEKVREGSIRGALSEFTNGIVLSGKAEQVFDKVVKSMGYSWSIQDGQLQILAPTEVVREDAVLLRPGTGMIGTPEPGEKGFVKARSLLQPDLVPGRKFKIESVNDDVNGFFRAEKCTFVGDTWGNDWYVDVEGKPL